MSRQAGPAYTEAFLSVVRNVTKEDTVQYVLALLDDMLTGRIILPSALYSYYAIGVERMASLRALDQQAEPKTALLNSWIICHRGPFKGPALSQA